MRTVQPEGQKGSLKWLQQAIEFNPEVLQPSGFSPITWVSPLRGDEFAEYRDDAFLELLGLSHLTGALNTFWPKRGPQWDALGLIDGGVVLVEAKAHLREFFSPESQAKGASFELILRSLESVKADMGVRSGTDWSRVFYQYTNRLAHLNFLRQHGVNAHLLFVSFIGDDEMSGPAMATEWKAAFRTADYALGLKKEHSLSQFVFHVHPHVNSIVKENAKQGISGA